MTEPVPGRRLQSLPETGESCFPSQPATPFLEPVSHWAQPVPSVLSGGYRPLSAGLCLRVLPVHYLKALLNLGIR